MTNLVLAKYMPRGLSRSQKLAAESVLDRNTGRQVKILPPLAHHHENRLSPSQMVTLYHWGNGSGCKRVAFYYTHKLEPGELMMATRALLADGTRPDRNQPMGCSSCGERIHQKGDLSYFKDRYHMT